jgi:hypothetical protein
MTGTTRSGRHYRLEGPPDESRMTEMIWRAWAASYGISDYADVTGDYSPAAR